MKKETARLTERKKTELRLIASLTLDATLAAEEKLSKLLARTRIQNQIYLNGSSEEIVCLASENVSLEVADQNADVK